MTMEEAIKTLKENYCAMCAYGSQDMDSCDIRSCDNKDAIKALEQTGWIPVSERLPEENKTVIASTKYGVYPEAKYTKRYGWEWAYEAGVDYWEEIKDVVTAWMPLPEKYKPESEEVNK